MKVCVGQIKCLRLIFHLHCYFAFTYPGCARLTGGKRGGRGGRRKREEERVRGEEEEEGTGKARERVHQFY